MPMAPRRSVEVRAATAAISRFGDGVMRPGPKWCSLKKIPSKPMASVRGHRSMCQANASASDMP